MKIKNICVFLLVILQINIIFSQKLKALVLGASGAVGREFISELCESDKWEQVIVISRRKLDQWKNCEEKGKLQVFLQDSLDNLEETEKWSQFSNYDSVFSLLGSQVKRGEDLFRKVDYHYPIYGSQIAKKNNIPHYGLLTSTGADQDSWFLYLRTKGQVEQAIIKEKLPQLSIYRPGLLLNRDNDYRSIEKIAAYIPFMSKISTKNLAKSIRIEAEQAHQQKWEGYKIYEHKSIEAFLEQQQSSPKEDI